MKSTVFNAEQIDGSPPLIPRKEQSWAASERAEGILKAGGAAILYGEQDRALYRPATDTCTDLRLKPHEPAFEPTLGQK
ncbi:hypothetical protein [Rugamonas aquatica]|uniref:hypothetical protein n=1 Tax=Rugamonas aquatica TaxID=2743357 RepID=UPI0015830532|nr:hypothetical protein [Rugamonas aquatica]